MGAVMSLSISPLSPCLQFTALMTVSIILTILIPYTKVEESFSTQAIHDFLYLASPKRLAYVMVGLDGDQIDGKFGQDNSAIRWDHSDFPGPVHRSFIGPFVVSLLVKPFTYISFSTYTPENITDSSQTGESQSDSSLLTSPNSTSSISFHHNKFILHLLSRIALSSLVMLSFSQFGNAIGKRFGPTTRRALSVLTLTQFHFLFYSSRALPNTFALITVMLACSFWLKREWNRFIWWMAFSVVVMRFETIMLFGWIVAYEVIWTRRLSLWYLLKAGVPYGLVAMGITV